MAVLVVASDRGRRERLLAALASAGIASQGTAPLRVTAAVAELRPVALVLDVGAAEPTRRALARAREAGGSSLPATLLLPARSSWLRAPLPPQLLPAAVLPDSAGAGPRLAEALRRLLANERGPLGAPGPSAAALSVETAAGALSYDPTSHELAGPAAEATLTPLEAALLEALLARPGAATPLDVLARALWGEAATADHHARAAIRTHVRTLRRKLAATGLAGALTTLPRIGYRIDLEG